jgi:hypothetical protein
MWTSQLKMHRNEEHHSGNYGDIFLFKDGHNGCSHKRSAPLGRWHSPKEKLVSRFIAMITTCGPFRPCGFDRRIHEITGKKQRNLWDQEPEQRVVNAARKTTQFLK